MTSEMTYEITKDNVKYYEEYKQYAPCTNRECIVASACFNEIRASKGAKKLKYKIVLSKPCRKAIYFFSILKQIPKHEKWIHNAIRSIKNHISAMDAFIISYYDGIRALEDMKTEYLKGNDGD